MCLSTNVGSGSEIAFDPCMHCIYALNSIPADLSSEIRISKPQRHFRPSSIPHTVIKQGHFFRLFDHALIQRYRCKTCRKVFSTETLNPCKYQKKRHLNAPIFENLVSGVSQRRLSKILHVNRKTVVRKFHFLGLHAKTYLAQNLHLRGKKISQIQFDDMETFEHSKLKPLSISLAVDEKSRFILGYQVASMPAKGLLVKKSLQKYGKRKDERAIARKLLFESLKSSFVGTQLQIKSDMNPHYIKDVRRHFPKASHLVYKGRRGCVVGQGELKAGGYDPLFALNHTAAMLRANLNRLFRRTWCTTKKAIGLDHHIALYVWYHNLVLLKPESS